MFVSPEGTVRDEGRFAALSMAQAIVGEKRITDEERNQVKAVMKILLSDGSKKGAIQALDVLEKVSRAAGARNSDRLGGSDSDPGSTEVNLSDVFDQALRGGN